MVIGTAGELKALGEALAAFVTDKPERSTADWPPLIQEIAVGQEFLLSFHLDTVSGAKPESNLP